MNKYQKSPLQSPDNPNSFKTWPKLLAERLEDGRELEIESLAEEIYGKIDFATRVRIRMLLIGLRP